MQILKPYRQKIDSLDDQIVDLLVEREKVIQEVAILKKAQNIPPVLQDRVDEVRNRNVARATSKGGSSDYMHEIYKKIIQLSCDIEQAVKNADNV